MQIQQHIKSIAEFIEKELSVDKINIASIGNIVSQCHIHIVGRRQSDPCWPNVVWGSQHTKAYEEDAISKLTNKLKERLPSFVTTK